MLVTVSGSIPPDLDAEVAAGRRPRADYRVIAERLSADLVDLQRARSECRWLGALIYRLAGTGPLLGWYAFRARRGYAATLTDGEQVGIPLALLTKVFGRSGCRHVMIGHAMSAPKKARLVRLTRIASQIDRYLVYASVQAEFLRSQLGVPETRVILMPFMVDTAFFDPARTNVARRRLICAAGRERRDYVTLLEAVVGLDIEVVITAGSLWSKRRDSSADRELPPNVTVGWLDMPDFRDLYAAAALVVLPLEPVDFQAGVTTILEAMSMGRAVICSDVPGQIDTVIEGVTGWYVPPGDAAALRAAIELRIAEPELADRIGDEGRRWVLEHADVGVYADAVAAVVRDVVDAV